MAVRDIAKAQYVFCKLFDFCRENGNREAKCIGLNVPIRGSFFCVRGRLYCCAICLELEECECVCERIKDREKASKESME